MAFPRKISKYSKSELYFDDVRVGFRRSLQREKQTFKVCIHARGWVLRDRGWTGKIANHVLMDFIIFNFLLSSDLDIFAKITKT